VLAGNKNGHAESSPEVCKKTETKPLDPIDLYFNPSDIQIEPTHWPDAGEPFRVWVVVCNFGDSPTKEFDNVLRRDGGVESWTFHSGGLAEKAKGSQEACSWFGVTYPSGLPEGEYTFEAVLNSDGEGNIVNKAGEDAPGWWTNNYNRLGIGVV
jgi:hypothetical protein